MRCDCREQNRAGSPVLPKPSTAGDRHGVNRAGIGSRGDVVTTASSRSCCRGGRMRRLARHAVCVLALLLGYVATASAEDAWVLWVKSENLWVGHEDSPSGRVLGAFPTKDECLARMEQVMNQVATWNNG